MILSAHQTQYLPYLGVVDKIDQSELFVAQDNVQYTKQEWQNRNRIRTRAGWRYLTIPVHFNSTSLIMHVTPASKSWVDQHHSTFAQEYVAAPYKQRLAPLWDLLGDLRSEPLSVINFESTRLLLDLIGIGTRVKLASQDLPPQPDNVDANERLILTCQQLGATTYLSGAGGRSYIDARRWAEAQIEIQWHNLLPRPYPQAHPGWIANLSVIDLIATVPDPLMTLRGWRRFQAHV